MYLIIDEDYRVYQHNVLTGKLRAEARKGELSIIDLSTMKGMNSLHVQDELGEWSPVQDLPDEWKS